MRPQLPDHARQAIEEFIRASAGESSGAVVGLSGGLDSATVARLCASALGPDKVLTIFMPTSATPDSDRFDVSAFCQHIGAELLTVDVQPAVDAFSAMLPSMDRREQAGNIMARCRMSVLYHYARLSGGVVMGTGNKSELLTGYFTKYGDGGVDFLPIGDLYKTQVRELAQEISVPQAIIDKPPSAGLWAGQTDEGEMGITYEELDRILYGLELLLSDEEIASRTGSSMETVRKVSELVRSSAHKRRMPLIPKLASRTIGSDWRE